MSGCLELPHQGSGSGFIIDPQGKIARVFLKVKPPTHSEEVLAALAEQIVYSAY